MENGEGTNYIIAGIIALASALGLPKVWDYLKVKAQTQADREAQRKITYLENRLSQIIASVDLLIIVIRNEFDDRPNIEQAIKKVQETLHKGEESQHV